MRSPHHPPVILALLVLTSTLHPLLSQVSGPAYRRAGIIDTNNVKTILGNWGVLAQPIGSGPQCAWPVATNGYVSDLSILIGVKLPGIEPPAHSVVSVAANRPGTADISPTGQYWTFEPVDGYVNSAQDNIASSIDRSTWPDEWPDHPDWKDPDSNVVWNGIGGPGILAADQELYYVVDDNRDERFSVATNNDRGIVFLPDSTDGQRKGLGLEVRVRHLEWAHPLLRDMLLSVYDITNQGTWTYDSVVFGQLMGTYVGMTKPDYSYLEYADDLSLFVPTYGAMVTQDYDMSIEDPAWQGRVGYLAHAFAATPSGDSISSYHVITPSGMIRFDKDEELWNMLSPGHHESGPTDEGSDSDYLIGSPSFSIAPGDTKRIAVILAYAYTPEDLEHRVEIAKAFWNQGLDIEKVLQTVAATSPLAGETIVGEVSPKWSTSLSSGSVDLWFSPNGGQRWMSVARHIDLAGDFVWNTELFPDGPFGILRLFVRDSSGSMVGVAETAGTFIVDNAGNGSPYLHIERFGNGGSPVVDADTVRLPVYLGDPERQPLQVRMFYKTYAADDWTQCDSAIFPGDPGSVVLSIAVQHLPNSPEFQLAVEVSDGELTCRDSTDAFEKQSERMEALTERIHHASGQSASPFNIRIFDRERLTGDAYVITFDDTSNYPRTTVRVWNRTRNLPVLEETTLMSGVEIGPFDGLMFYTEDTLTHVDSSGLQFNTNVPADLYIACKPTDFDLLWPSPMRLKGYPAPNDYIVSFSDQIIDTLVEVPAIGAAAIPVKLTVFNRTSTKPVRAAGNVTNNSIELVFFEEGPGDVGLTWDLFMITPGGLSFGDGDTLFITTTKGLTHRDTIEISGTLVAQLHPQESLPRAYRLEQNFPNPFNPSTSIRFELPQRCWVTLEIYNILGQKLATLLSKELPGGPHQESWNADVPTGSYLYRLQAISIDNPSERFVEVKKMILLR